MADAQWLEKRRQGWFAVVYVPARLHHLLPKKLRKGLGTQDLKVAQVRRLAVLAELRARIALAEKAASAPNQTEAMGWREHLRAAREQDERELVGGPDDPPPLEWMIADQIQERAEAIERKERRMGRSAGEAADAAGAFLTAASLATTPLLQYLPAWLEEGGVKGPYRPRTKRQLEGDIVRLGEWMKAQRLAPTLETIGRKHAGAFVTDLGRDLERKTVSRIVSACRAYWVYLGRKGHVPDDRNPWDRQAPPKVKNSGHEGEKERPFTSEEMGALLRGPADAELADLMRVAALSGMRIEEVYRLTVADCDGGVFRARRSKTTAGVRSVPIHPDLGDIVARRVQGKEPGAFLFHEAGTVEKAPPNGGAVTRGRRKVGQGRVVAEGAERSMAASKRFGRYREAVGVAENVEGKRRSLVNFHSFRRWFVTEALRNGQLERVVMQVVGHKPQGVTLRSYHGGDELAALRACVEAVRLPNLSGDAPVTVLESP